MTKIGVIGGSGLEKLDIFSEKTELDFKTEYGNPSSSIFKGKIKDNEVLIISRHGRDHTIPPTQVNNLANIKALKDLGCDYILASAACGSLRENIHPGDLVIPDQFIDFTRFRKITFFNSFPKGDAKHTAMPDPFSLFLRQKLSHGCIELNIPVIEGGTILTIEGPRFSTRAESRMYRVWGADLVNMSIAPEVVLANEIGIPYACIAMSTDYDAWNEGIEPVSWDTLFAVFQQNAQKITKLITHLITTLD